LPITGTGFGERQKAVWSLLRNSKQNSCNY
jgi:hypothetical protein